MKKIRHLPPQNQCLITEQRREFEYLYRKNCNRQNRRTRLRINDKNENMWSRQHLKCRETTKPPFRTKSPNAMTSYFTANATLPEALGSQFSNSAKNFAGE